MTVTEKITAGSTFLGIELGSTRIKAVLTDDTHAPIASGSHNWENRLENGFWTYSLEDIHNGIQKCFSDLAKNVKDEYGTELATVGAMGVSAMMHGYMAFDTDGRLLVPFRTWRNTTTERAAAELTELFGFNIPQRWSVSHLYQAVLNSEPHISQLSYITTLAVYIHEKLTGKRCAGIGEASGMFPINGGTYDGKMMDKFALAMAQKGFEGNVRSLFPEVLQAGENAGTLTEEGAKFLDPTGHLKAGIPLCPPEGDAGTGMTATNSVLAGTGNVSAGTSIFAMLVLDKPMKSYYPEIDIVTTPDGSPVAMVHCNNCCSELDAWVRLMKDYAALSGADIDTDKAYELFYRTAMEGDKDCGGLTAYNYLSGEPVTGVENGKPMYFRTPDSKMNLANFCRTQVMSAMSALKLGMDILIEKENASATLYTGHGGMFKVKGCAQQILADGLNAPVSVMKTAGEGGAWGMALLAAFMIQGGGRNLPEFLDEDVFTDMEKSILTPDPEGTNGFDRFIALYKQGLKHFTV